VQASDQPGGREGFNGSKIFCVFLRTRAWATGVSNLREISCDKIKITIEELCVRANYEIGADILQGLRKGHRQEESPVGKAVIQQIIDNDLLAQKERMALCQDTGMVILFVEIGQEACITGGNFHDAVNSGIRKAYKEAYLRKSVVSEPLMERKNTGDNTPAIVYFELVPGDQIKIDLMVKGFGSENMSLVTCLTPADGEAGVKQVIIDAVRRAGPNPCPPIIVGVGVGGTFEKAALLAKKALLRKIGEMNPDTRYARLEKEVLEAVNNLGIGPAGLGGRITALAVHMEYYPTHIASIPVAVNLCCHASRHAVAVI
jgi:fumarate hydratase subunit alpha